MKTAVIVFLMAALPAAAQMAARPPATSAIVNPGEQSRLTLDAVRNLERAFDAKLGSTQPQPMNIVGATRGLYLPGFGMVFTAELDLTLTPTAGGLFRREITADERAAIHTRKLAQLLVVKQLMRDMLTAIAQKADTLPDSERVVLAVRLWYQAYEDQTGLPSQIRMTADRKSAIAGQISEVTSK